MLSVLAAFVLASPPSYSDSYAQAVREGRPLVVFVGVPAMPGPWISQECRSFPGLTGKGVVLSRPRQDFLEWVDTLDWWTDASGIERRIQAMPPLPRPIQYAPPMTFAPRMSFGGGGNC